ncbi:MAG: FkbM family methyltransferase [Holosporaceae bacterium]|jgi:hypothetical protein|nr:FkbM family methyltransferase [Holosporaceae bacterium]
MGALWFIEVVNINEILEKYFSQGLGFLSIDVEGLDLEILNSLDSNKYKPKIIALFRNLRPSGNFRVAPVLGSSRTSSTLRSCAPWTPKNSSELLGFERGLICVETIHYAVPHSTSSKQYAQDITNLLYKNGYYVYFSNGVNIIFVDSAYSRKS